jgi:transketolase
MSALGAASAAVALPLSRGRTTSAEELSRRADWIRLRTIDLVEVAKSGHYSSVFSCAELLAVLYYRTLRLDPAHPDNPDRDRFLFGKGHAAIGLYPCLADLGFFPQEWLESYTRIGSPLGDHPDMRKVPGIDFSSGSIGHNLSVGVGMAKAARITGRDHRTVVMLGDGELNEGQVWEAFMAAAHYRLGNLVAVIDLNGMSLDGRVSEVMGIEPVAAKVEAFGWRAVEIDGHDIDAVIAAFDALPDTSSQQPTCVLARTVKGKGVPFMEDSPYWHLGYLGEQDKKIAVEAIERRMA